MPDDEKNNLRDQARDLIKQQAKNRSKIVLKNVLRVALPYIAIILIAVAVFAVLIGVVNTIKGTIQNIGNSIVHFFTGDNTSFEINDEQLDELIAAIEGTGIDLEDLELLRRY